MTRISCPPALRPDILWIAAALLAATAVFGQVAGHGFVDWDDPGYILNNPRTLAGLSLDNLRWAATAFALANWHPLTFLSHMADVDLWGLWPGGHHLTSLAWHLANTALFHVFLRRAGAEPWRAGIGALIFAVHPLHVESVAWVSERKDVLSGFFWLVALILYQSYARRPSLARYGAVALAFALGLAAKPMLVTLPLLLLVLDWWPLRRFALRSGEARRFGRLLLEKFPLLALTAASAALTLTAQSRGGALTDLAALPLDERIANALVSYARYLLHSILPLDLHYLYERTLPIPLWQTLLAAVALVAVSGLVWRARARQPAWLVGWLWFLGTLVPVIGIVQVGNHAMADRYMYMPLAGLLVAFVWSLPTQGRPRMAAIAATGLAVLAFGFLAHRLTATWESSLAMYRRAVDVDPCHCRGSAGYANQLINGEQWDAARERIGFVLGNCPEPVLQSRTYALKGKLEQHTGQPEAAIATFRQAIVRWPGDAAAYVRLGALFMELKRYDEAVALLRTGLALLGPDVHGVQLLVEALARSERPAQALREIESRLQANPNDPTLWLFHGLANERAGALDAAIHAYEQAVRRAGGEVQPRLHLARALAAAGRNAEAQHQLQLLLRIEPGNSEARRLLDSLGAGTL